MRASSYDTTKRSSALASRLENRLPDLESAVLDRLDGIGDPTSSQENRFLGDRQRAMREAIDYGLQLIHSPGRAMTLPIPPDLLVQARLAARDRVGLDIVLRGYCAGNTVFNNAVIEEAEGLSLPGPDLTRILQALTRGFDRLLAMVADEYSHEPATAERDIDHWRISLVRKLLAGEIPTIDDINYDFAGRHVALIAIGDTSPTSFRALSKKLDRRLLLVRPDQRISWAWLGGKRPFDVGELDLLKNCDWPPGAAIGYGDTALGVVGWRRSHRQAAAVLRLARQHSRPKALGYGDAALAASALKDHDLLSHLKESYLNPLAMIGDDGHSAKETLRVYFASARNATSAAAALGVSRGAMRGRLAAIEERLGRPLHEIEDSLALALRLENLAPQLAQTEIGTGT